MWTSALALCLETGQGLRVYEVVENSCAMLEMSIASVLGNFPLAKALPSRPGLRQRSHRAQGFNGALE